MKMRKYGFKMLDNDEDACYHAQSPVKRMKIEIMKKEEERNK